MKSQSQAKQIKAAKGPGAQHRRSVAIPRADREYVARMAKERNLTESDVLRSLITMGRRAAERDAEAKRLGGLRADVKVLEVQLNDIAAQLNWLTKNQVGLFALLKSVFAKVQTAETAGRPLEESLDQAYRNLIRDALKAFEATMKG